MPQEAEVISKSTEDAEETVVHRNEQDQELEVLIEASRAAELALQSAEKAVQAAESNRRKLVDGEIIESSMVVRQQPAAAKAKTVNGTRNLEKVQTELEPGAVTQTGGCHGGTFQNWHCILTGLSYLRWLCGPHGK
jgi:hypothetical protein